MARLGCVWGQRVGHDLAQVEAVIVRAEVAHSVLVVTAAEGDDSEKLLAIAKAAAVTLGAEVGLPLKAVLPQHTQLFVMPKVEGAHARRGWR